MSAGGLEGSAARVAVIGVGNTLLGDDGIGYCLARALVECGGVEGAVVRAVQTLNPGHVELFDGVDYAVFIDAYVADDMPSGADIALVELDPLKLSVMDTVRAMEYIEPHSLNPLKLLLLARAASVFRGKALLVGVRPERIEFGVGLSMEAVNRALKAFRVLVCRLGRLGVRVNASEECVGRWLRGRCRKPLLD